MTTEWQKLEHIGRQAWGAVTHHPYDHQPEATTVTTTSPLVARIEADLHQAGIDITADVHGILAHHLTTVNLANHVLQAAAAAEKNPVVQALESAELGAAGESMVATWITDLAQIGVRAAAILPPPPAPAAVQADDADADPAA